MENPLLDCGDFDEVLSRISICAKNLTPHPLPTDEQGRSELLARCEQLHSVLSRALINVLQAMSIERDAIRTKNYFRSRPPLDLSCLREPVDGGILQYLTAEEFIAWNDGMNDLWGVVKGAGRFGDDPALTFKSLWADIRARPSEALRVLKSTKLPAEALPENRKAFRELMGVFKKGIERRDSDGIIHVAAGFVASVYIVKIIDLNRLLVALRGLFRGVDGLRGRVKAARQTPPAIQTPVTVTSDGPFAKKKFQWDGKEHPIPHTRWKMLKLLWDKTSISDAQIGEAIWGEGWDESSLSTAANRLNNDLRKTPWRVTRADGVATLSRKDGDSQS